jgi:Integral membrane protein S linking to the trans Golgi network
VFCTPEFVAKFNRWSAGTFVINLSLHHFFDWRWLSFHTFSGWMVALGNIFNALCASVYLTFVVRVILCTLQQHHLRDDRSNAQLLSCSLAC